MKFSTVKRVQLPQILLKLKGGITIVKKMEKSS